MRPSRLAWVLLMTVAITVAAVTAVAWAGSPEARAGIDADTVDGHHAAASSGAAAERANRVLWATPGGKLSTKALPMGVLDRRYLGKKGDTFLYVPGSELVVNFNDPVQATILYSHTGVAWVRKTGSAGTVTVVLPMQLPAQQSGEWIKLVDVRVYYQSDNAADYIDNIWILRLDTTTGGHATLGESGADLGSIAFSSYVVGCTDPGCSLSWPTGGFITVLMDLKYAGTGDPHDLGIAGVLLRYSYD